MMRRLILILLTLVALVGAGPVKAETITIKLGTMAPDGSAWHSLLKQMAQRWSEVSGGTVKLKIYPGGVAGNEGDMVRKLRVRQLQAAALSVVGLHDIEAAPQAISTPGLIGSEEEWQYVFSKMAPVWEKRFIAKGFVPLMWGDTGWAYMFFSKPLTRAADAKGRRVFAWAGDPASVRGWELAGFQPVVISSTDILPSLTTGMIEGFGTTPIMAFTARWFERAKYMVDAYWGHLPGGTLITKETWDKIAPELREKLMPIAREVGDKVNAEVNKMQADSIAQMKKAGLQIVTLNEAEKKVWTEMAEKAWPIVREGVVAPEDFDEVKRVRDEFRRSKGMK